MQNRNDDASGNATPLKTTTAGQIDKAVANYRALLEKYAKEFTSEAVQTVPGQPELVTEQLSVFKKRVEAINEIIVRRVRVHRNQSPKEALKATTYVKWVDDDTIVDEMPMSTNEEVEVYFFRVGRKISTSDLDKQYKSRGLKPDPIAQAKVHQDDPAFSDSHPNAVQWKNKAGKFCLAKFFRKDNNNHVVVNQDDNEWDEDYLWFGGVRK